MSDAASAFPGAVPAARFPRAIGARLRVRAAAILRRMQYARMLGVLEGMSDVDLRRAGLTRAGIPARAAALTAPAPRAPRAAPEI